MSRKEVLNQADPSEIFAMRVSIAADWVKDNLRYILYGALGLIVIAAIVVAWNSWQHHRRETASVMLHQALKLVKTDPNAQQQQAADPDQAMQQLKTITEKYGRTPAGARAFWYLGHLYMSQGKSADALKAYDVARRRMPNRQSLSTTLAMLNMGYAQESTDACGDAVTTYESVQQSPIQWLRGEAYLGMGRCHEKTGDTEKAIEVYDRALADISITGSTQQTISERLARLRPDEPEAPAAPSAESSSAVEPKEAEDKAETASESEATTASPAGEKPTDEPVVSEPSTESTQPATTESSTQPSNTEPSEAEKPSTASQSESNTTTEATTAPKPATEDKPTEERSDETTQNAKN